MLASGFRLLVAMAMLLTATLATETPILGDQNPQLFLAASLIYMVGALIAALVLRKRWRASPRLAFVTLGLDLICITVAMHASGGVSSGLGGLLVVFVGASALSLPGQAGLAAAALATFALLAEQALTFSLGRAPSGEFLAAGTLAAVIFAVALLANPLSRRIRETEELARQRGIDLANLSQLNDYIIQNLRESIVVVDPENRIRLMNQSAADQLGARRRSAGQDLVDLSLPLYQAVEAWRDGEILQGQGLSQFLASDGSTRIKTHIAPLGGTSNGPILVFLEDASLIEDKVQQSKLAALGRLSASIAHEVRNPVGALSHAAQLLAESPVITHKEQRMLDIIQTNSQRVSKIVDSVMQLSRRDASSPETIGLKDWIWEFISEISATLELPRGQISPLIDDVELVVVMDPGHLHQVVWNLCENALKYGHDDDAQAEIEIRCGRLSSGRPYLAVQDQGPGITAELTDTLFEPFATGRSGGSGLGLFISRELCERNRASLRHESRAGGGSIFRIIFSDPDRWGRNP